MPAESIFQVEAVDGAARAGLLRLASADVPTPYFMPIATRGMVKDATFDDLAVLDFLLVLMNTYHLICRPGVEVIRQLGGLRKFSGWERAILTDSGGFQIFSLSPMTEVSGDGVRFRDYASGDEFFLSPEDCVDTQLAFGSDVAMALDICTCLPAERKKVEDDLLITHEWMARGHQHWAEKGGAETGTHLFGIVQGGVERDLREKSVELVSALGFAGIGVGGLSVGESREDYESTAAFCAGRLPPDRPRYLMGVGTPADILQAVAMGYDLFDCVLPTRMARHGVAYGWEGYVHIRQEKWKLDDSPLVAGCACRVCKRHSKAFIRHLFTADELSAAILLTFHNLHFYRELMTRLREAIANGKLAQLSARYSESLGRKL